MSFNKMIFDARMNLHKHSPAICTAAGILSMLAGVVLAVKATKPAIKHIEEADIPEDASKKEKAVSVVKAVWKDYVPTAVCEIGGIALIVNSDIKAAQRNALIANNALYFETAYKNLQDKLEEKLPKKKVDEIRDSISEDRMLENLPDDIQYGTYKPSYDGKIWFYDELTGHYFRSTYEAVDKTFTKFANDLVRERWIEQSQLLAELGESGGKEFDKVGWEMGEILEILHKSHTEFNGEVLCSIEYTYPHPI